MIPNSSVIANNAADLRNAVNTDNGVDYVYLAQDITLDAGITIHPNKDTLVIDGEYPPGSGIYHQFTDIDYQLPTYTLGVRSTSDITLTLRNMTIRGLNYYGVPYIVPSGTGIDTSRVTVIYENVTYTGPQITYHHSGTTRYIDCTITILKSSSVAAEEVGEVKHVEIGGRTTIQHYSTTGNLNRPAVFWFREETSTSSLTILAGADVRITSANNYFMFNLDGTFSSTLVPTNFVIQAGASFRLTVNMGISYTSSHVLNSFSVAENALFYYVQTASNSNYASLYISGALTVGQTSRFFMEAESATQPLIYFTNNAAHNLVLTDPLSFVLYNANAAALNTAAQMPFSFEADQINIWTTATRPFAEAGGFNDTPQHKWNKRAHLSLVTINGTFTNAATTIQSSNITADDTGFTELNQFLLGTARVLSVGDIRDLINPVVDDGRDITGVTEPGANIRAEYENPQGSAHTLTTTAGDNGRFVLSTIQEVPPEVPAGTQVAIWFNTPFIIKRVDTIAIGVGEFELVSVPDPIVFNAPTFVDQTGVYLLRHYPAGEEAIVVSDTRVDSTAWQLLVSVHADLTAPDGSTIPGALVYKTGDPEAEPLVLSAEPIVIYVGAPATEETRTVDITWPEHEGVLARISQPIRSGVPYTTRLFWDLRIIEAIAYDTDRETE